MKAKIGIISFIVFMVLLVSYVLYSNFKPEPPAEYEMTKVAYGTVVDSLDVVGKVESGVTENFVAIEGVTVEEVLVNVGDKVKRGEILGTIGCTGQATGIHLHFQIDKGSNATSINPYDYIFKDKELVPAYTKPDATVIWYTVKKGDNLSKIAKKYGTTWQKIYKDNKYTIGSNPNKIYPNQKLKIVK